MLSERDYTTLARLRTLAGTNLPVPADLVVDAVHAIEGMLCIEDRRMLRDRHIRCAAALLDGDRRHRAARLAHEAQAIGRIWPRLRATWPEKDTLRGELHAAALAYRLPTTAEQFGNIIYCEMSTGEV